MIGSHASMARRVTIGRVVLQYLLILYLILHVPVVADAGGAARGTVGVARNPVWMSWRGRSASSDSSSTILVSSSARRDCPL
jgi:hypothetical protein